MISASVGVNSSLLLEPSRELLFPLPHSTSLQRSRCNLKLTNLSLVHAVVFRVRTRNPDAFSVRPTHGLVTPGASFQVTMTATAQTCKLFGTMDSRDLITTRESSELFLLQSLELGESVWNWKQLDLNATTSLRAIWKQMPKECITENKLVCRFMKSSPEVTHDKQLLLHSMVGFKTSSHEHPFSCNELRKHSRNETSRYSESSSLNRSFSNQFTPPEELQSEGRDRRESVDSDASFHTTIEFPRILASTNDADSCSVNVRRPETNALSKALIMRQRGTSPHSQDENVEPVNDTMPSADTILCAHTQDLGPLLYYIQPSDVLSFNVKPGPRYWGTTSFFIVNASQTDCLIFKVRTSNQLGYVVKPSRGVVSATSAQQVDVSIAALRNDAVFNRAQREAKDGFMIDVTNISREKYGELIKMDQLERSSKTSLLCSLVPQNDWHSTRLSVELKVEKSDGSNGSNKTSEGEKHVLSGRSSVDGRFKDARRQSVHSVVHRMKELFTFSSMGESHNGEDKLAGYFMASDSDESPVTKAPTIDVETNYSMTNVAQNPSRRGSAVIVVSSDRMDTVDFSNPKLSFFI